MGTANTEAVKGLFDILNNQEEYLKQIKQLDEKKEAAENAVKRMQAEQGALKVKQEEVEEAISTNHKAKSEALKAIEYEERLKRENTDILKTLQSKQSGFDTKLQELKQQEKEVDNKINILKHAQHNLDEAKEDFKNRVALIESREKKIIEFAKTIS